ANGAKWLVAVDGGSHSGPFTSDPSVIDVGALIAGVLHAYLEGDATAAAQLPALAHTGAPRPASLAPFHPPPPAAPPQGRWPALSGGAGLALVAAACGGGPSDSASNASRPRPSTAPTTPPNAPTATTSGPATAVPVQCVLTPEMTEGPYYLTGEPERRDVTE